MTFTMTAGFADRGLDVGVRIGDGETVALMGANGAGKSSVLGLAAGLLRADRGEAMLEGRRLFGPGHWMPPHRRSVALLAQEALLFPQLTVLENVAFGPRSSGASRREARERARRWLAEAEAAEPSLLLLDEPLAALDVAVAPVIRRMLRRVLDGRRALIVTHDILDALHLADRVVVLEHGRVAEEGTPRQLLSRPRSSFAAGLAGLNLISGRAAEGGLGAAAQQPPIPAGSVVFGNRAPELLDGEPAVAAFSPAAVSVFTERPHGSPRNVLEAAIEELEPATGHLVVRAGRLAAEVTHAAAADLDLQPGRRVFFAVKASEVAVYPARSAG